MCLKHRPAAFSSCLCALILQLGSPGKSSADPSTQPRAWNDYQTIMWVGDTAYRHPEKLPLFFQRLREMGIRTGMVYGAADPQPLLNNHFPYYVENMVNRGLCLKFNSTVIDWDKTVTDWARTGRPETSLVRDYCLDDPAWLQLAEKTTREIAVRNAPHHPIAYNIRDELSTTISANPFDYDFNPATLEQFRVWLKTEYAGVAALNSEWETQFSSWDQVRPFTTDQIKHRMATGLALPAGPPDWSKVQQIRFDPALARQDPTKWNFSPWADFRTYMDISLARALGRLREAARSIDPSTPVGVEGTQMPAAFGGYDLWRLSQVLDWVEPYDIGCARSVFGSFMPTAPILTTVFESTTALAQRRLWHLLLEGDRGCLVWWSEDCLDWRQADWPLTAKAKALTPVLNQMTSPLARLFLRATRERDPVFIYYSQPSIQVDWLVESTLDGSTWLRRFSSFEAEHNTMAKTRAAWLKALQDLGYAPQFLSSAQLEAGNSLGTSNAVLILDGALAISDQESVALKAGFGRRTNRNGFRALMAEGPAGVFDQHGKLRLQSAIEELLPGASTNQGCLFGRPDGKRTTTNLASRLYLADRLGNNRRSSWLEWVRAQLDPLPPEILVPTDARTRIHRFRVGDARLVAFERNIDYQMSEDLKQVGGNQALESPAPIEAVLRYPTHVYDLLTGTYLGLTDRIRFTLDPWQPSLFALLPSKVSQQSLLSALEEKLDR